MKILLAAFFGRSLELEGGQRLIDALARSYVKKGVQVTVLAPIKKDSSYTVINYLDTPGNPIRVYLQALKKHAPFADFVHVLEPGPSTLVFSSLCCRYNPNTIAMVATSHFRLIDLLHGVNRQFLFHFLTKNKAWNWLWSYPCKRYIVSTRFQRQQLVSCGVEKNRILVVPYGLLPEDFKPADKSAARKEFGLAKGQVIGYLGHFHHNKDVVTLLNAFRLIGQKHRGVGLAIAWSGKGTQSRKILGMIQSHPCKERITLLGVVDVRRFLAALDALVLPYPNSTIPYFPLVMIEAFAMQTPVITTAVGGLPELIKDGHSGLLVEPRKEIQIADAVVKLLSDDSLRRRIKANEKTIFKAKFDANKVATKMLTIFRTMNRKEFS